MSKMPNKTPQAKSQEDEIKIDSFTREVLARLPITKEQLIDLIKHFNQETPKQEELLAPP